MGTNPEDHMVPHTSSLGIKSFSSLTPVNSHVKPTNHDTVLKYLLRPLEIQSYA